MQYGEVIEYVQKIKLFAKKNIEKKKWNEALSLISCAAEVLYNTNLYYVDRELEEDILEISNALVTTKFEANDGDRKNLLFYDGFGLDRRGLAQIYLKALCKLKRVVYVTYEDAKGRIPEILSILEKNNGVIIYLKRKDFVSRIICLKECVEYYKPEKFFFYSLPNDVVGTTIMNAYHGIVENYQINLTDHAFWLGAGPVDVCIEFRDYGASISTNERKIPKTKIRRIPFYPIINYQDEFQGFPFFNERNSKVVFSGGSLYKTLSADNRYYKIVDYILDNHSDVVFWYAGSGDRTEMDKLILKYPGRVYLTAERPDLFQVLQNCYLYLSTYPLCGGLMFQYAAKASKVPITLRQGNVTDDFLISQNDLKVQFDDIDLFFQELDHLLNDPQYAKERGMIVEKSVISEMNFQNAVSKLLLGEDTGYPVSFEAIDTTKFRQNYLDTFTMNNLSTLMANKENYAVAKVYPILFFKGYLNKIKRKLNERNKKCK